MKRIIVSIFLIGVFLSCIAAAPRTGSWTESTTNYSGTKNMVTTLLWTADSTGTVAAKTTTVKVGGIISQVITDPDTSLVPAIADSSGRSPSDNYDIAVTGTGGSEIMGGALANRDSVTSEIAKPLFIQATIADTTEYDVYNDSALTFTITNNIIPNARGYIYIFWRKW